MAVNATPTRCRLAHVAPKRMYYAVFGALMVGTALTVLVA